MTLLSLAGASTPPPHTHPGRARVALAPASPPSLDSRGKRRSQVYYLPYASRCVCTGACR